MTLLEELQQNIYYNLVISSPVLSGNMQNMISALGLYGLDLSNGEAKILISAPSYDMKEFKTNKVIVHDGKYNYAYSLNESGAFGRHNKSEHWVNRVLNETCDIFAKTHGGQVVQYLPN